MAVKTFTTGEVLTAADTNTYLNNGGLVYVTSQTIGTTVASVTVSNCFSSTYDNYRIISVGGVSSTATNLTFQLSGITGASAYRQLGYYQTFGSSTITGYAADASTIICGHVTTGGYWWMLDITYPNVAATKFGNVQTASTTTQYSFPFTVNSSSTAASFTIAPSTGTITGGTIVVYGYRKA